MRAYFCILEVAVSANRCSIIQGCRICNYMEEDGNSSYLPTPLNASITSWHTSDLDSAHRNWPETTEKHCICRKTRYIIIPIAPSLDYSGIWPLASSQRTSKWTIILLRIRQNLTILCMFIDLAAQLPSVSSVDKCALFGTVRLTDKADVLVTLTYAKFKMG